jgi:hypothetical protein
MLARCTSMLAFGGLKHQFLCPRCHMDARVFNGVLMVDGDVTWFNVERDTWHAL